LSERKALPGGLSNISSCIEACKFYGEKHYPLMRYVDSVFRELMFFWLGRYQSIIGHEKNDKRAKKKAANGRPLVLRPAAVTS
jgi:hypothetical protein